MTEFHTKPVLVPVDYSIPSRNAACIARSVAESDQDVTLLHVALDFDLVVPSRSWVSDIPPDTEADRVERLKAWRDDNELGDVRVQVRVGDPGTEVCKAAEELGTRLIVMSSHGHHGLKRLLLGSVAERILRHCHCSALVLHRDDDHPEVIEHPEEWFPRKRVVVPVDFSESSRLAVEVALQAADAPSSVDVINVVPHMDDPVLIGSTVMTDEDRRAGREDHLKQWLADHGYGSLRRHVLTGDAGTVIVNHAAGVKAELIVMPSHGYHGLKRLVLGSTTERVLRHALTPVLVIRRTDAD
ncbi:MAG: universal stress protein [Fuerstiella sp.]